MFLYNVTVNVDPGQESEWLRWMKKDHLPKMLATNRFYDARILKLLNESQEATGTTFAVQYLAHSLGDIENYLNNEAEALRKDTQDKFGDRIVAFRTVLEEV